MYNLNVDDLTIDGFDLKSAEVESRRGKFFWKATCINGLDYSSLKNNKPVYFRTPADAIIAFTKRCCAQNLKSRYYGN